MTIFELMKILGIETSCDETGVAIFDMETNSIISEQLYSQLLSMPNMVVLFPNWLLEIT